MRIHGKKMEDVAIIEKILHSKTPKFDYVRMTNHVVEDQALKATTLGEASLGRGRGQGGIRGRGRGRGRQSSYNQGLNLINQVLNAIIVTS
ncbi:hypothetical protein F0562_034439 [Nyssa sinensis]|uniref:Uncharacterized protein n=1 Tax=Nyssa sinensis TaxID=561372 RepID=A0A5J5AKD8_9ASTE|nr:hypothetical protein F0562_034439 [Nyssa sinensis]